MIVVALVSGGKDSCHALGLAMRSGHEVACLANLAPPKSVMERAARSNETEEIDSHCFQTVGALAVEALAEATGLPLVRRHIRISASIERKLAYDDEVPGDEVEDLAALLSSARRLFPEARGVVSGAVASDYQRLRVEHACLRAGGLVSLAPLWRRPQEGLLREMIARGPPPSLSFLPSEKEEEKDDEGESVDAIIVKVASVGLGREHVGARLSSSFPRLMRLAREYGSHPAGEGGEYETMTLDCHAFTRARLEVAGGADGTSFDVVDAGAGTFVASGLRLAAVPKGKGRGLGGGGEEERGGEIVWADGDGAAPPRLPSPLAPSDEATSAAEAAAASSPSLSFSVLSASGNARARVSCARRFEGGCQVTAVAEVAKEEKTSFEDDEVAEAVAAALDAAGAALRALERGANEERRGGGSGGDGGDGGGGDGGGGGDPSAFRGASHVRLYLPSMRSFGAANATYGERMPRSSPPARACVACELGGGEGEGRGENPSSRSFSPAAVVDVLAQLPSDARRRTALHVQSISTWAPACIGPYAQAVAVDCSPISSSARSPPGAGGSPTPPRPRSSRIAPPPLLLRMAGQIGLDPWEMELVSVLEKRRGRSESADAASSARLEARRALRSCQAVAVACRSDLSGGGMASCAVFASAEAGREGLEEARRALDEFLASGRGSEGSDDDDDDDSSPFIDDYLRLHVPSRTAASPLLTYFVVDGLPRNAAVEFEPLAWASDGGGGGRGRVASPWSSPRSSPEATTACDALIIEGELCMARAVSRATRGQRTTISEVFGAAVSAVAEALDASGMTSLDSPRSLALVSARAFYRSSFADGSPTMSSASKALARAWRETFGGSPSTFGLAAAPVAVPVAALGCDERADGDVVVEVHFEGGGGERSSSEDDE